MACQLVDDEPKGLCQNCFNSWNQYYCEICDMDVFLRTYEKHLAIEHQDKLAQFIADKARENRDFEFGLTY